jgi:hypothetical protein
VDGGSSVAERDPIGERTTERATGAPTSRCLPQGNTTWFGVAVRPGVATPARGRVGSVSAVIDTIVRGWFELSYFILGGIGLFILALASLIAATSKRGIPQLRGGSKHGHIGELSAEECPSSWDDPMSCMWEGMVEVTNIGSDFLVVQHAGIRRPDEFDGGGIYDSETAPWTVDGKVRNAPFTLAPGEIAMKSLRSDRDVRGHTGTMQINLLVRRWWRRTLEDAYMEIGGRGSTSRVKFGRR